MAREPGVGLDGDQVRSRRLLPLVDRRLEPLAVPLGRELAVELGDEQAPVGEDQHAFGARRLDEPGGCDRLPGSRRVAEAIPARSSSVLLRRRRKLGLAVDLEVVLFVLELLDFLELGVTVPVPVRRLLVRRDQLR